MKILLSILAIASAVNCGNATESEKKENQAKESVEQTPVSEAEETEQDGILLGTIEQEDLASDPHAAWFDPAYNAYEPKAEALETIRKNIDEYDIKLFMGTWCGDSRREVPKFLKLLELADYNKKKLQMWAVSRGKTLPNGIHEEHNVQRVPTIIFYKDGKEVGRFVEYPQESLAADIAAIVSGEPYQHSYE